MEKFRETIGRYLPFAWWVFLALLAVCGCVCCSVQAAAGIGKFWAVCGAIGSGLSIPIYATQAYVEWLDRNNY